MCQLCGLPSNHDNDLALLGYLTLAAWSTTAILGIWWWRTARLLRKTMRTATQSTHNQRLT